MLARITTVEVFTQKTRMTYAVAVYGHEGSRFLAMVAVMLTIEINKWMMLTTLIYRTSII